MLSLGLEAARAWAWARHRQPGAAGGPGPCESSAQRRPGLVRESKTTCSNTSSLVTTVLQSENPGKAKPSFQHTAVLVAATAAVQKAASAL